MEHLWYKLTNEFRDYCVQNGFKTAILGLSGGLDSAICAVLAADVLGGKNVKAFMMKTQYTSDLSIKIAREIAELNNLSYQEIDIEPMVLYQSQFFRTNFQQELTGVALENLQARIRGQLLMTISNQMGGLVMATGNKSEAYVGYCTLYGDTCGGIMPIGNIYKSTIFELAHWRNTLEYVLPLEVITRAPSAELALGQKDEDSLPPYSILDSILKELVDKKYSIDEVIADGFDKEMVEKVAKLVSQSSFKRNQLAKALEI